MGVKLARSMGAEVTMFSTSPSKQKDAERLGASGFVLTRDPEALKAQAGRFDFILDTVSAPHDIEAYLAMLRPGRHDGHWSASRRRSCSSGRSR